MAEKGIDFRLYLVTDPELTRERSIEYIVEEALKGGVTLVQLRDKKASDDEFLRQAGELRRITEQYGVPLLINDRVDLVSHVGADGVHIGPEDCSPAEARRLLGSQKIIGVSAGTIGEAKEAEEAGADYLGVGSVFGTSTKPDAGEPLGTERLGQICRSVSVPVVAIGGVTLENAGEAIASGAAGIAVVTALTLADNVRGAAENLKSLFAQGV